MNRPFTVLGVQQIAIGGDSLDALRSLWVDTLGVTKTGEYESASENVREDILTLGEGQHAVEIDLMEPLDPDGRPRVCLLYTSPSPRDQRGSRMPSSA